MKILKESSIIWRAKFIYLDPSLFLVVLYHFKNNFWRDWNTLLVIIVFYCHMQVTATVYQFLFVGCCNLVYNFPINL